MSKKPNEINDDEIRIISAYKPETHKVQKRSLKLWILIIIGVMIIACVVLLLTQRPNNEVKAYIPETVEDIADKEPQSVKEDTPLIGKGYTIALDTTVNNNGLLILTPENARAQLIIGTESLNDPDIILATQAADVRGDNGQIAGSFVLNGEVISKGEAKAGFCSIINGDISIGIADATPMFEQTLTEGGDFFRQYPLVVGGQIVENRPKGKAIRKALAEIGGQICVVMSKEKLTFHDFSQLLIDAGARNAIYLVGSSSYGFYITETGEKTVTGQVPSDDIEYINYIIWKQV